MQPRGIVPFTASEFLDVFAAYNQALWPLVAMLWLLTALVMVAALARASAPPMLPRLLLAGHWLWAGLVYHALFFTAIDPAAWLFAAMFVTQGVMLVTFPSGERPGTSALVPCVAWSHRCSFSTACCIRPSRGPMALTIRECPRSACPVRRSC